MEFLMALWQYVLVSSPYLLLGFFFSGLIKMFFSKNFIKRYLGQRRKSDIFRAALIGVPLPLCSCSVVPTAVTLKKAGASNSATSAFLISTPESGVDSIVMTYGLMDLPMTIARPVAAFISAFTAGILNLLFNEDQEEKQKVEEMVKPSCPHCTPTPESDVPKQSLRTRFKEGIQYAFGDLIDDMAFWLVVGLLLGAMIDWLVPANFFETLGATGGRIAIILVGVPLYICASASTPVAASLMLKGMSPGMGLLFLLVGPATNISNMVILQKYIGKKGVVLNILAIVGVALGLSYLLDFLYVYFDWGLNLHLADYHDHANFGWIHYSSAAIMTLLLIKGLYKEGKEHFHR